MKNAGRVILGTLLLIAAVTVQAARSLTEHGSPWLPPATVATAWVCLLAGAALLASSRSSRNHDGS